jgi:hypothetical protein
MNHAEKRLPERLALDLYHRHNDRRLIMEWITGAEILSRKGWDGLRLQRAFDGGGLCPHRAHDNAILTPGSRCFTCPHAQPARGYQPVGCLRSDDASLGADFAFDRFIKSGIEELRGTVDKQQFDKGFPADLFCRPEHKYDADLVRFVEDRIGSHNLRAMLLETHCRDWAELKDPTGMLNRLMAAKYIVADVERYEQRCGLIPAMSDTRHDQRAGDIDPKDFAERELTQGKAPGQVMLALVERYGDMPKWKVAGLALRRSVVDLNEFERDKLKSRFYDRTRKFRP